MKAYGALGVSLIVLTVLGYIPSNILVVGFLLVLLDAYTTHLYYKDVQQSKDALLTAVGLLWYISNEEEEELVEED